MITKCSFIGTILFFLLVFCIISRAADCPYGSAQALFKLSDGTWENATAHPVLHRGETFEIQVVVTTYTELSVFFLKLHEFGTPVYSVRDGPCMMEQIFEHREMMTPGQSFSYVWIMQVDANTSWVNGYAPLEIYAQFHKNERELASVNFDVLVAYITDQPLEHRQEESFSETSSSVHGGKQSTPSDGIGAIIIIVAFFAITHRRRKSKDNM